MTPSRVWALTPRTARGYRRAWARERLRDSFWPVPAVLLVAGVALAAVNVNARSLGVPATPAGGRVVAVHAADPGVAPVPAQAILAAVTLGQNRTVYQDPSFGIRQLVDIAIQALSPAVNQPTTAVQVIDRLEDLLVRIGPSPLWR